MGTTISQTSQSGSTPPLPALPPVMALRTYTFMRLGAIGVIAVLAVSLFVEAHTANCLQGSISAYYYTSVQSVFVGALVALGLVMIVLWGKTPVEDGLLNLAGMLAPVVAFVPTARSTRCSLTTATGADVTTPAQKAAVLRSGHDAIDNNMLAYFIVVGLVLAILLVVGLVSPNRPGWSALIDQGSIFWIPWAIAVILGGAGAYAFWGHRDWFYHNAHGWSASIMFVFIIGVVADIGYQKRKTPADKPGARWYWSLALLMVSGTFVILVLASWFGGWFDDHRIFAIEAWLIGLFAIFWVMQTFDRLREGAPRTEAEKARMAPPAP